MRFLKKLLYTEVKDEKTDKLEEDISLDEFPASDEFPDLDLDGAKDLLAEDSDIPLEKNDLGFLDDVTQTDFTEVEPVFLEGEIDIKEVLRASDIDLELEEASGQYTMEKIWELLNENVPKESLPAVIKVSGQSVADVVQNALQKGAACDQFEQEFRQRHQNLLQSITEEMSAVEQETDDEIQRLKEEIDLKIKELEEKRTTTLEELRQQKQQGIANYDKAIEVLDDYENQCAEVVRALKQVTEGEVEVDDTNEVKQ